MTRYKFTVPPTMEVGSYSGIASDDYGQSYQKEALWDYNNARDHDGLQPLKRMPKGTKYVRLG